MNPIPLRTQLWFVALAYAAVFMAAAALLFARHLQELKYPVDASGGMWAAGDLMLYIFIAGLFTLPTGLLIWITAKFELFYTGYTKFLLALSLTAPVCLGLIFLKGQHLGEGLFTFCLFRLVSSPVLLLGIGISRLVARFDRAKRFSAYALLIEFLTFVAAIALLIIEAKTKSH